MLSYYQILLVPTDADYQLLKKRYHQISRDSERKWPTDPYYPMSLDLFQTAYQTLINPAARAAYDQENNIIPQEASYKPCLKWTVEQIAAHRGRTPGPYFAHIGIANLLNGGQIDFVNGCEIRRTLDKQLVLISPEGDPEDTNPPYRFSLPGCIATIDHQQRLVIWRLTKEELQVPFRRYDWHPDSNEWFEYFLGPIRMNQAKAKHGPINAPDPSKGSREDQMTFIRCPVCRSLVEDTVRCTSCTANLTIPRCWQCGQPVENESEPCPNCGHNPPLGV